MMEIHPRAIMNSVTMNLLPLFSELGATLYTEATSDALTIFPAAWIRLINFDIPRRMNDSVLWLNYFCTIKFRSRNEPTLDPQLERTLDTFCQHVMMNFTRLYHSNGKSYKVSWQPSNKADGELNMFFNITLSVKREEVDGELMEALRDTALMQ